MTTKTVMEKVAKIEETSWFHKLRIRESRIVSFKDGTIADVTRTKTTHSIHIMQKTE